MTNTINNGIPFVPENTIDPAAGLNESLLTVDALLQLAVVSVGGNTPPGSPANGARYIVGTAPTGAWSGRANQVAQRLDGAWRFYAARYALNLADGLMYVRQGATWSVAAAAPLAAYTLATLPSAAANPRLQVYCSNLTGQAAPVFSDGTNWRRVSDNTIAD